MDTLFSNNKRIVRRLLEEGAYPNEGRKALHPSLSYLLPTKSAKFLAYGRKNRSRKYRKKSRKSLKFGISPKRNKQIMPNCDHGDGKKSCKIMVHTLTNTFVNLCENHQYDDRFMYPPWDEYINNC